MNKRNKQTMDSVKAPEYIAMTYFLRQRRKALGMTMAEVAEQLKVATVTVANTETNLRRMDVYELKLFCEILGVKVVDVIEFMDQEANQQKAIEYLNRTTSLRKNYGKSHL